jgi:hypothetical protein
MNELIKNRKFVSQIMLDMVPYLPEVHKRNTYIMGPLLETLCLLTMHHTAWTESELESVFEICKNSLIPPTP